MYDFFNKELLNRVLSVIIFVPLVIMPIICSNYASLIIYLVFASIILSELDEIESLMNKTFLIRAYKFLSIFSFFFISYFIVHTQII